MTTQLRAWLQGPMVARILRAIKSMLVGVISMFGSSATARAMALSVMLVLAAAPLRAQDAKPDVKGDGGAAASAMQQPAVPAPPAGASSDPGYRPGFIDAFGRLIGDSASKLNSQIKNANETLGNIGNQTSDVAKGAVGVAKDAVDTARDAAGTIIGLPNAHVVTGHEPCGMAPNGAPDCRTAADAACRGKGFASGHSLDTQSAQKCSARVLLSGRPPGENDCPVETFVTRAVCQ